MGKRSVKRPSQKTRESCKQKIEGYKKFKIQNRVKFRFTCYMVRALNFTVEIKTNMKQATTSFSEILK